MSKTLDQTKKIMGALVRMPPKPHEGNEARQASRTGIAHTPPPLYFFPAPADPIASVQLPPGHGEAF